MQFCYSYFHLFQSIFFCSIIKFVNLSNLIMILSSSTMTFCDEEIMLKRANVTSDFKRKALNEDCLVALECANWPLAECFNICQCKQGYLPLNNTCVLHIANSSDFLTDILDSKLFQIAIFSIVMFSALYFINNFCCCTHHKSKSPPELIYLSELGNLNTLPHHHSHHHHHQHYHLTSNDEINNQANEYDHHINQNDLPSIPPIPKHCLGNHHSSYIYDLDQMKCNQSNYVASVQL